MPQIVLHHLDRHALDGGGEGGTSKPERGIQNKQNAIALGLVQSPRPWKTGAGSFCELRICGWWLHDSQARTPRTGPAGARCRFWTRLSGRRSGLARSRACRWTRAWSAPESSCLRYSPPSLAVDARSLTTLVIGSRRIGGGYFWQRCARWAQCWKRRCSRIHAFRNSEPIRPTCWRAAATTLGWCHRGAVTGGASTGLIGASDPSPRDSGRLKLVSRRSIRRSDRMSRQTGRSSLVVPAAPRCHQTRWPLVARPRDAKLRAFLRRSHSAGSVFVPCSQEVRGFGIGQWHRGWSAATASWSLQSVEGHAASIRPSNRRRGRASRRCDDAPGAFVSWIAFGDRRLASSRSSPKCVPPEI